MTIVSTAVVFCAAVLQAIVHADVELTGQLVSVIPAPRPDSSDAPVSVQRTSSNRRVAFAANGPPSCENRYGPMCGDCTSLWSCVGSAEPVLVQNCELTHPGKPLCERNACTDRVSNQSGCAVQWQCTGQGYFPDPLNCQQYYFCAGAGGQSLLYECPNGYAYNANTTRCRRSADPSADPSACVQVDCAAPANWNRYAEYAGDRQLYAFCLRQLGVLAPVMLRCPGGEHHRFNQTQQRCVFECPGEGRFTDYADQQAYYECLPGDEQGGWTVTHQRCLPGFWFVQWKQQCQSNPSVDWDKQTFDERSTLRPITERTTPATTTTTTTTTTSAPT